MEPRNWWFVDVSPFQTRIFFLRFHVRIYITRWWFHFSNFNPEPWGSSHFDDHIFQIGWFSHQLDKLSTQKFPNFSLPRCRHRWLKTWRNGKLYGWKIPIPVMRSQLKCQCSFLTPPGKLTWQWKITSFDRRHIFIHGWFSIVMLVFRGFSAILVAQYVRRKLVCRRYYTPRLFLGGIINLPFFQIISEKLRRVFFLQKKWRWNSTWLRKNISCFLVPGTCFLYFFSFGGWKKSRFICILFVFQSN